MSFRSISVNKSKRKHETKKQNENQQKNRMNIQNLMNRPRSLAASLWVCNSLVLHIKNDEQQQQDQNRREE